MKKLIYLISIFLFAFTSEIKASHLNGYDMTLISLGNDLYKFRLNVFRDIYGTSLPNSFDFNIWRNADNLAAPISNVILNKISSSRINYSCNPDSVFSMFIEKHIYESSAINLSAFTATAGYYIASETSARVSGISNVLNSGAAGLVFTMEFPRLNSTAPTRYNSSPEFTIAPTVNMGINKLYTLDFNVYDPNGDSLFFYTLKPSSSGTIRPFIMMDYAQGYSLASNIADGAPDFKINSTTGIITYKPKKIGKFAISIRVEEYKRAVGSFPAYKIGVITREFLIECVYIPEYPPIISDKKNRLNLIKDTINIKDTTSYFNRFLSKEQRYDSVFMKLVPEQGVYNNILNNSLFDVKFGKVGAATSAGTDINDLIIKGKDSLKANFTWKIDSTDIKKTPYKFKVISYDKTCPAPLADTLDVELSILGQCYNSKQISLTSCDSLVDLFGRKHFANTIAIDTIKNVIGCDSIFKQFITVNKSSKTLLNLEACDSVLALDGKYYHQNTTIKTTLANASNCDSIITENINVIKTPKPKVIRGDVIIIDNEPTYYYGTDFQLDIQYVWKVINGNIISGQGTNLVEVKWLSNGVGILNCIVFDNQMKCSDSSGLSVNIATGINDIKNSNIKIYPNPTNNIINIEGLTKSENTTIQIFEVQGKLVITKTINEKGTIDLSELNKGVYVIKIGEVAQRIVKM
jgi:hypothetical protein